MVPNSVLGLMGNIIIFFFLTEFVLFILFLIAM